MEQRNVDVTKGRDAMAAGWSEEQLARAGPIIVHLGNLNPGAARLSGLQASEVASGQAIVAMNSVFQAEEGVAPVRWTIAPGRLDVVENPVWTPIARWLNPRLLLRMPRKAWDRTETLWRDAGWAFEDDASMVPGWRETIERLDSETVPVPYTHLDPPRHTVVTYGFCTDAREERFQDWLFDEYRRARALTGCGLVTFPFKSGIWDNWPSRFVRPQGVYQFTAQGIWQREPTLTKPDGSILDGGILTLPHYAPGEFEACAMRFLRRLLADGFEILLNEAYPHRGKRWLWADENPDVAEALVGEGVYRRPWEDPIEPAPPLAT